MLVQVILTFCEALPHGAEIVAAKKHGVSNWNHTDYIEFQLDSKIIRWFLKVGQAKVGLEKPSDQRPDGHRRSWTWNDEWRVRLLV
jgi:hypothetical protein